jgi:hypothetical protein
MRRLFAMVAILALSLAYVSADAASLAGKAVECCTAGLCPMHRIIQKAADCEMDLRHPEAQLQSCPSPAVRYAGLADFVRVPLPVIDSANWSSERLALKASPIQSEIAFDVAAPPPRISAS